MHAIKASLCAGILITLCANTGLSQVAIPQEATDDEAVVLEALDLEDVLRALEEGQLSSGRILEGGDIFSVTMLHRMAPTATIHGALSDLYLVKDGSATLVTGGSLVDPQPASRPGDQRGSSIRGGVERVVKAGDVVFIPPGMVHGFKDFGDSGSITYLNIHFPWKK